MRNESSYLDEVSQNDIPVRFEYRQRNKQQELIAIMIRPQNLLLSSAGDSVIKRLYRPPTIPTHYQMETLA